MGPSWCKSRVGWSLLGILQLIDWENILSNATEHHKWVREDNGIN